MTVAGHRRFYKMSGSGNDFVFLDGRLESVADWSTPEAIRRICARGTGVGADGIVVLRPSTVPGATLGIDYWNADGSLASLCGNATLCATRLAAELGDARAGPQGLRIETGAGVLAARMVNGQPEFDLEPVSDVRPEYAAEAGPGELRIGYCLAGVPHVVVRWADGPGIDAVPLETRGPAIRHDPGLPAGANANFVCREAGGQWSMRTFERGVEGETLACGTGAVATAILLAVWGESGLDTELGTRSGRVLTVRLRRDGATWLPTLRGEGRIVFEGLARDL
ncbi:MAG: diaminopimelate epimerase [Gemmatimonadetes bacterium]|nr:diaminopimelate epimerase [Gemmatimonadota bacterium]